MKLSKMRMQCSRIVRLSVSSIAAAAVPLGLPTSISAAHTSDGAACRSFDLRASTDRATGNTNPCILAEHRLALETGYYQNASALGGTQQAAYPLAHLRYGLGTRTELSFDPATRIAKSGLNGQGIYTWSRSGGGVKQLVFDDVRNATSLRFAYTPQSDETASLSTRERYDLGIDDRWAFDGRFSLGVSFGVVTFTQQNVRKSQSSSAYVDFALRNTLSPTTDLTLLLARRSRVVVGAEPQTSVGFAVHHGFSSRFAGDAEIGTALNGTGDTKAHYIGFGFSAMR